MTPKEFYIERRVSQPLDKDERQTNNLPELFAAIATVRLFAARSCKICVMTDSEYVFLGATGKAQKWQSND